MFASSVSAYEGIGASLGTTKDGLFVVQVFPGSPAAKAGVRPGDRIVAIDGRSPKDLGSTEAAAAMRGKSQL